MYPGISKKKIQEVLSKIIENYSGQKQFIIKLELHSKR